MNASMIAGRTKRGRGDLPAPRLGGLVHGELIKLRGSRVTWAMALVTVAVVGLMVWVAVTSQQYVSMLRAHPLDGAYRTLFGMSVFLNIGTGAALLVLSARAVAQEYDQGTIRVLLGRGVGRLELLVAKLAALAVVGLLFVITGVLLMAGVFCSLEVWRNGSLDAAARFPPSFWAAAGVVVMVGALSVACCIALATAAAVVSRSGVFAMAVALGYFPIDNLMGVILPGLAGATHGGLLPDATAYELGTNLNAMLSALEPGHPFPSLLFGPAVRVDGPHTVVVVAVHAAVLLGVSLWLTAARDISR